MATKKIAAKKTVAKTAVKKGAAKSSAKGSARSAPKTSSASSNASSTAKPATKAPAKKAVSSKGNYTKPELRERIKDEVMAGDKGGRPGQWSARKAQLVAHEYEAEGGAYKGERTETQQHLKQWGDEKWHTADGEQAIQGKETHRYLPDEAWKELSPEQKKATDEKKVRGSKRGEQFVPNTAKAKTARKHVVKP